LASTKFKALSAVVAASLFLGSCGLPGGGDGGGEDGLAPGDYAIASAEGVRDSVVVSGKIAPIRAVSITSAVQSEVERIEVAPGDRVRTEQLLAEMNTEQLDRELQIQERQQANAQAEAKQGVDQAQAQLDALNASVANGTHPSIRAAQAQVNQAQAAYDAAVAANGGVRAATRAVRVATDMAGQVSSWLDQQVHGNGGQQPAPAPAPAPAPVPVPVPVPAPVPVPGDQVQGYPAEVPALEGNYAPSAGMSTQEAYAALQDAQAELAAARSQVEQERIQLQGQVDSAWRAMENSELEAGDGTLEYQVKEATIYSPINGLVTSVDVQEGDVPQGRILSIADDSRLIIRAEVREADVASIAKDNRVTFTSTATGKKEYAGRVTRISPAGNSGGGGGMDPAAALAGGDSAGGGEGSTVMFPVEIEVTGDKEGLLLGGSVRAEIITAETDKALNVPLDAVYEDGGKDKVLVLATDGDDAHSGKVEEREVKTDTANDVDIAVTGGDLKAGDIVINWPDEYRDRIGETVSITDPSFDPASVEDAKNTKTSSTATVTVTSTRPAASK